MKLKFICIAALIPFSSPIFAMDFCSQLGKKLKQSSSSNSIVQEIRFNYSLAGIKNHPQMVEYRYNLEEVYDSLASFEAQNSINFNDDEIDDAFDNYDINRAPTSYVKLEDCKELGNSATFIVKRIIPYLQLSNTSNETSPQFNIEFIRNGNNWKVSNVSSYNFVDLVHQSAINKYKELYDKINRTTVDTFYSLNLRDMTKNEVYPAHTRNLTSYFNGLLQGIN